MKQIIKVIALFTSIYFMLLNECSSQSLIDSNFYYKKARLEGVKVAGYRVGKWSEIGPDNVVYSENIYDSSGFATGIWLVNMPDGTKRLETEYRLNEVIKVTVYRNSMKIIEIQSSPFIKNDLYRDIRMFDDRIFANNQKTRIITTSDPRSLANQRGSYWIMGAGYFDQFMQITDLLKRKTFTGLLIVYDEEGNHRRDYQFDSGSNYRFSYVYSGKKLKEHLEYSNDTLVKKVKYKNGLPVNSK